MTAALVRGELSLRRPLVISAAIHGLVATALFVSRSHSSPPSPPTYRVNLIAAPPGERAIGVVQPTPAAVKPAAPMPTPAPAKPAPAPIARTTPDVPGMKVPARSKAAPTPKRATPNSSPTGTQAGSKAVAPVAPRAGGGPTGGKGADVANVSVDGIAFPYPGYLENVVRQIALRFRPPSARPVQAVVAFLIRRDGSVTGIRLTTRSGVYSFDTEAMGAVDAAAQAHAFGPLPQGFSDDVLPVIFSFDPRLIR